MWPQSYTPVAGSLVWSALTAAIPVFVLLYLLGVKRKPSWMASLAGLASAALVAAFVYRMPVERLAPTVGYGAAFGLFPIGWVVFSAIVLYRVTLESGKFELLKDSIAHLTDDSRLQALLIAFGFGGFIEGAAGFGTPVAVAAAMLAGLGFTPFYAAAICLLANTAPVAFGSIGTPLVALAATTGLPIDRLCAATGRICAPLSLFVPAYLVVVMSGWKGLRGVLPAVALCGFAFAATQLVASSFVGAQLISSILASLACMGALVILLRFWKPKERFVLESGNSTAAGPGGPTPHHSAGATALAWGPYILLVVFVLLWGFKPLQVLLNQVTVAFGWPGLHNMVLRMPPVTAVPSPYAAVFNFNWLSASGTACLLAAAAAAMLVGLTPRQFGRVIAHSARQLALAELTLAAVLALAFVMNYSGATATLGLAFSATGVLFPFFGTLLGWLGVFLTGSDTSANALFGNLQVVTATKLGISPVLMAAANSSGGVMGKMISLTSIAVAVAATSMKREDESLLFRFTLRHSLIMATTIGLVVLFYAYVAPQWAP